MKKIVSGLLLVILTVLLLVFSWLGLTQSGMLWLYQFSSDVIPGKFQVNQLSGKLIGPIELSDVHYLDADGSDYSAHKIIFDWNPVALLSGSLDIQSLSIQSLHAVIAQKAKQSDNTKKAGIADIKLPLQIKLKTMTVKDISLKQGVDEYKLAYFELSGSTLLNHLNIKKMFIQGTGYEANLQGSLQLNEKLRHNLKIDWTHRLNNGKKLQGQGNLEGNQQSSTLNHKTRGALNLAVQAQLKNLLEDVSWQADITLKQFNSRDLDSGLPELSAELHASSSGDLRMARFKGRLSGRNSQFGPFKSTFDVHRSADNQLKINQLTLNAEATETHIQSKGSWSPNGSTGLLDLDLSWQNLKWPQSGAAWFNTPSGTGRLSGSLEKYQFELDTDRPRPEMPPSNWKIKGQGGVNGMILSDMDITTLQGRVQGKGSLDWESRLKWDAQITIADINPAAEWQDWPGKLSGFIKTKGGYLNDRLIMQTEVSQLKGVLRDYPVNLSGKVDWNDGLLKLKQIQLKSGQSEISLSGQYGDSLALDWSVNSPVLDELYPAMAGTLTATGRVIGTPEQPVISSQFNGARLVWEDMHAQHIKGSVELDWKNWYPSKLDLQAKNISAAGVNLLSAEIKNINQTLSLKLTTNEVLSEVELKGQLQGERWSGEILKASVRTERFSHWHLQEPAQIKVSRQELDIGRLCFKDEKQDQMCVQLDHRKGLYQAKLDVQQLPVSMLKPWLPADLTIEGYARAQADLTWQPQQAVVGNVTINLAAGEIRYPLQDSEIEKWSYRNAVLNIKLDERGIDSHSRVELNENDAITFEAFLPAASLLQLNPEQPVQATAQLNIKDIRWLEAFIPEVQKIEGGINLRLKSNGTLKKPEIQGIVDVQQVQFLIPRLGLSIENVQFKGETDDFNKLNFEASVDSGKGQIKVKGNTRFSSSKDWISQLTISGEDFEVSKIPEARVNVSPQIKLSLKPGAIEVTGNLHVPYARLSPKDISTAAQVSNDVVIVGQDRQPEQKWAITTSIRITLEPKYVQFKGFGFDGRIGGSLLLEDSPGQLTRATGEIKVPEGRYRAYSQRLVIENGRLLYTGGPLINPGLDFRAVRVVNDVTAGLKVSGTLRQPILDVFSIPAMGQTDALSYIVLGRPMESSSSEDGDLVAKAALAIGLSGGDRIAKMLGDRFGLDEMRVEGSENGDQASLVVGRYLSPKLYVSYGVGLIESINTFSIRYQLSSKWQLKAESGETQGGDLLYTIER